jgi:ATP:corrinoid adenosyltransferase
MQKRKAVQDAEVAAKTLEKGLLIVHTGPGKGKSTAAFGLAAASAAWPKVDPQSRSSGALAHSNGQRAG